MVEIGFHEMDMEGMTEKKGKRERERRQWYEDRHYSILCRRKIQEEQQQQHCELLNQTNRNGILKKFVTRAETGSEESGSMNRKRSK
ncbi:hypothetical protein MTR_4g132575 [Medicago truncatula]|uniref:Uncharacterized protein n=1 Tax=Medicago truncatula TaxID=3880 RepID=A0A072USK8_MEDTR|nr:hypothetical protein MTR_4g132575 [Medicago truncatula]